MQGIVDIHAHILPGVDDGSRDMEMTREMLRMAWAEGIRTIIATPHHRRGYAQEPAERLRQVYQEVRAEAQRIHPDFEILLGSELFHSHTLESHLASGEALSMAGSHYLLVEFRPSDSYRELHTSLQNLRMLGYRPILAHAERCQCLVKEPPLTEELVDMGCYIQVNSGSVTGENGFAVKRYVKTLLKYEMVHFLGTDAHDLGSRRPAMKKCVEYIAKKYGEDYASRVSRDNALRMVEDRRIENG